MELMFENSLARMYGPSFLFLYSVLFSIGFYYLRFVLPLRIGTKTTSQLDKIPDQPDPYKIAYLRQAEYEVLILAIFNLMRRGYFSLTQVKAQPSVKAKGGDLNLLSKFEKDVYQSLKRETSLGLFIKTILDQPKFMLNCDHLKDELVNENLIWSDKERIAYKIRRKWIICLLIALGSYKLIAAVSHGHSNILGIVIIAVLGCIMISRITVNTMPTPKGHALLEKFRSTFKPVYGEKLMKQPFYIEQLLVSIHGFGILNHSTYGHFYHYILQEVKPKRSITFENALSYSGGDSSSSSCSSGGCGSSCGGGCGGCGGCS